MSDGRWPGPLDWPKLHWPTGIAPGSSFTAPAPLGPTYSSRSSVPQLRGDRARRGERGIDPGLSPHDTKGSERPAPVPLPREQPALVAAQATAFLGPVGPGGGIIVEYYAKCGLETVGPGQAATGPVTRFTTFEGLLDALQTSTTQQNVIVNHGSEFDGLLIPYCRESAFSKTGQDMGMFALLAEAAERGPVDPTSFNAKLALDALTKALGVKQDVILRIVDKLVRVRRRRPILHFRACNLSDNQGMVTDYKRAFGAQMVTFHSCRLLYQFFRPAQMKAGLQVSMPQFSSDQSTSRDRLRPFTDPLGLLSPLLLALRDIDGHTRVGNFSFLEQLSPDQVQGWAEFFVRRWRDTNTDHFVMPIMWDDSEVTFHCPMEPGWRQKLQFL